MTNDNVHEALKACIEALVLLGESETLDEALTWASGALVAVDLQGIDVDEERILAHYAE